MRREAKRKRLEYEIKEARRRRAAAEPSAMFRTVLGAYPTSAELSTRDFFLATEGDQLLREARELRGRL